MASRSGEGVRGDQFGSTDRISIPVTDHNGGVFRTTVHRCVNVTTDPELRDALLSGSLYEVQGPDGANFELALPICYHDEELELFALVIPDALRHREFELRRELLDEMAEADGLPRYVRGFETVCGLEQLQRLEEERASGNAPAPAGPKDELAADGGEPQEPVPAEANAQLDAAWREVEQEREQLEQERQQLDEVAARIDRERARMDDVERELAEERTSLEELRSEIEAMKLNLEQERLRMEHGGPQSNAEESTQVVTDDQFIEVVEDDESSEAQSSRAEPSQAEQAAPTEATELIESPYAHGADDSQIPVEVQIERIDAGDVAASFDEIAAGDNDRHVAVIDGRVLASAKLSEATLAAVEDADQLSFFVQYRDAAGYPIVGLLLAALDVSEHPVASVGWALDVGDSEHEIILNRLDAAVDLHAALYDTDGELAGVYHVAAPLSDNIEWIRQRAERLLTNPDFDAESGSFADAAAAYTADDTERLGTMRHNFRVDSFEDATTPAELELACGIVGYWSTPEKFEYLVANRSFPVDQFEAIQQRVVRRAVQQGLFLNPELRQVAVHMGLAADEIELAERLVSEFAELSVGLRKNDLDPIQEWENWEALVSLAEELGVTLDPDVLELAEASLKRAQDFQETDLADDLAPPEPVEPSVADISHDEFEVDELVVARRSETTGVTYFLPDDAVLDTFDDLASMPREDLELLLEDPKGRLEATQMLIERFGAEGTETALEAAEQMSVPEVAALARFVETKAEGLEAELVRCAESGGPSATYIAARALASIRTTSAIPTLLDAYRDDERRGDKAALARAIAEYGDKLLPQLKRVIKKDGHDAAITTLLRELEQAHEGTLAELAKDRSKKVRSAASAARDS